MACGSVELEQPDVIPSTATGIIHESNGATVPPRDRCVEAGEDISQWAPDLDSARGTGSQAVSPHDFLQARNVSLLHRHRRYACGGLPCVGSGRGRGKMLQFRCDEEMDPITQYRPTEREAVLQSLVRCAGRELATPRQPIVPPVRERGTVQVVRSRLRDGVDQRAGEITIADIARSDEHLVLLHRIERNGLALCGGRDIAVHEALVRSVDQKIVESQIRARTGDTAPLRTDLRGDLRCKDHKVVEVPVQRRQPVDQ